MKTKNRRAALCLGAAAIIATIGGAAAQQPQPRPPAPRPAPAPTATSDAPQQTTATYGDWVVQCVARNPGPGEVCEMAQVVQVQGKGPFSRVAIGQPEKTQPVKLVVQVPVNVSLAAQMKVQTSDEDPGLQAPFATCIPNGCFAVFELKEEALKKFRSASAAGKLTFAQADGHAVAVPISFNGFGQAFEALAKK